MIANTVTNKWLKTSFTGGLVEKLGVWRSAAIIQNGVQITFDHTRTKTGHRSCCEQLKNNRILDFRSRKAWWCTLVDEWVLSVHVWHKRKLNCCKMLTLARKCAQKMPSASYKLIWFRDQDVCNIIWDENHVYFGFYWWRVFAVYGQETSVSRWNQSNGRFDSVCLPKLVLRFVNQRRQFIREVSVIGLSAVIVIMLVKTAEMLFWAGANRSSEINNPSLITNKRWICVTSGGRWLPIAVHGEQNCRRTAMKSKDLSGYADEYLVSAVHEKWRVDVDRPPSCWGDDVVADYPWQYRFAAWQNYVDATARKRRNSADWLWRAPPVWKYYMYLIGM